MRKLFFFSLGLVSAFLIVILYSNYEASSRTKPPKLRATIIFPKAKESTYLGISFSHASHARLGYKKCTSCHNDEVFSKDKAMMANKITMEDINNGKFCGHCHNGKLKNKEGELVFGPKVDNVPHCVLCHNVKDRKKE